jgi:hypothetical protein
VGTTRGAGSCRLELATEVEISTRGAESCRFELVTEVESSARDAGLATAFVESPAPFLEVDRSTRGAESWRLEPVMEVERSARDIGLARGFMESTRCAGSCLLELESSVRDIGFARGLMESPVLLLGGGSGMGILRAPSPLISASRSSFPVWAVLTFILGFCDWPGTLGTITVVWSSCRRATSA